MNFANNSTIAVFGDWHGNRRFALAAIEEVVASENPAMLFHVGDFGFWPLGHEENWDPRFLSEVNSLLEKLELTLIAIDGNHEDFDWLSTFPLNVFGMQEITTRIWRMPRGSAITINGKKIVGLGGALSIDRKHREKDYSWFEAELITREDVNTALAQGKAAVLLTHEAPAGVFDVSSSGDRELDEISATQRAFVAEAAGGLEAKILVHGHHHRAYIDSYRQTQVIGLGADKSIDLATINRNHVIIDLGEL